MEAQPANTQVNRHPLNKISKFGIVLLLLPGVFRVTRKFLWGYA